MSISSLSDLKKSSKRTLQTLMDESQKLSKRKEFPKDTRFWNPTVDKAGNGYAIIRFLPAPKNEKLPWARFWDHAFKGPSGKWYIEKSLMTLEGMKDPVTEFNSTLWAKAEKGDETAKAQARAQKRRENFISNILVVNDPEHPENNGKVFLYRYGKKLYENKIKAVMFPDEDLGQEENDPFNFWTGQNFKLKIKNVAGYRNYDESAFAAPSQVAATDAEIEAIWDKEYSLAAFTDPKEFKSYDELKAKLNEILADSNGGPAKTVEDIERDMDAAINAAAPSIESTASSVSEDDMNLEDLLKDI